MKKQLFKFLIVGTIITLINVSCEKKEEEDAPDSTTSTTSTTSSTSTTESTSSTSSTSTTTTPAYAGCLDFDNPRQTDCVIATGVSNGNPTEYALLNDSTFRFTLFLFNKPYSTKYLEFDSNLKLKRETNCTINNPYETPLTYKSYTKDFTWYTDSVVVVKIDEGTTTTETLARNGNGYIERSGTNTSTKQKDVFPSKMLMYSTLYADEFLKSTVGTASYTYTFDSSTGYLIKSTITQDGSTQEQTYQYTNNTCN